MLEKKQKSPVFFVKRTSCEFISATEKTTVYDKNSTYISNLPVADIFQTSILASNDIPENEVALIYEEEILEDLGLPMDKEYIIKAKDLQTVSGSSKEYAISVIEKSLIEQMLSACSTLKHLDFLIPTPCLYESLFKTSVIEPNGDTVVIYIGKHESFGALFREGRLSYYKNLEYTFDKLLPLFNESSPEEVDRKQLFTILAQEEAEPQFESPIRRLYSLLAEDIEDFLVYIKRLYQISDLKHVYFDNAYGFSSGIYTYLKASYDITCQNFSFRSAIGADKDDMIKILCLYFVESAKAGDTWCNYTVLPKPKPVLQRDSGRFLILSAAALIISVGYPAFNYLLSGMNENVIDGLKKENAVLQKKEQGIMGVQKQLQQNLENVEKELKTEQTKKDTYLDVLESFVRFKNAYVQKSAAIIEFSDYLRDNRLYLESVSFQEEGNGVKFLFDVVGKSEDNIASFVDGLAQDARFDVDTKEIAKYDNLYESKIEVRVK